MKDTKKTCPVEWCDRTDIYGGTYCNRHYSQVYIHGKVSKTGYDKRPAIIQGDIAKIPLGLNAKDGYAIVDADDAWVDKYNWVRVQRGPRCEGFYADSVVDRSVEKPRPIHMHNFLMGTPKGMDTDHIDNNGLNNRRSNLRIVTRTINNYNSKVRVNNTSGYKGVSWSKHTKAWRAYIGGSQTRRELGHFKRLEDAIAARLKAEKELGI